MKTKLLALLLLLPLGATAAPDPAATRTWLVQALAAELDRGPQNLNLVASLAYPLGTDYRRHADSAVKAVLERTGAAVAAVDADTLDCEGQADRFLARAFLHEAGLGPAPDGDARVLNCLTADDPFAQANLLLSACRFGLEAPEEALTRARTTLKRLQLPGGALAGPDGQPRYYLTSHAILALHFCGRDADAVARGQQSLLATLQPFGTSGFLDGLAESLIFLRWMEVPIPDEDAYREYLYGQVRPDGGLCYVARPGCEAHWHATSLLLELLEGR